MRRIQSLKTKTTHIVSPEWLIIQGSEQCIANIEMLYTYNREIKDAENAIAYIMSELKTNNLKRCEYYANPLLRGPMDKLGLTPIPITKETCFSSLENIEQIKNSSEFKKELAHLIEFDGFTEDEATHVILSGIEILDTKKVQYLQPSTMHEDDDFM